MPVPADEGHGRHDNPMALGRLTDDIRSRVASNPDRLAKVSARGVFRGDSHALKETPPSRSGGLPVTQSWPARGRSLQHESTSMSRSSADAAASAVEPLQAAAPSSDGFKTCVVYMLGYPGMGKRTVGGHLAELLDGVLVDNALINRPLLELFRWDGIEPLPPQIWQYAVPIREAVLATIQDLAPLTNSYVFTNVIEEGPTAADEYDRVRSVAHRRGSLFLAVMLSCDIEAQVSRIDNPDRVALRKGADPEGYRGHRLTTTLYQPPAAEAFHIDTTEAPAVDNAERILAELTDRGFSPEPG